MLLSGFNDEEDVFDSFTVSEEDRKGVNIIFAAYDCESYEGSAFVIFEQDGKLYEVNGGHCSCYGLEDQWSPDECTIEELEHRMTEGSLGTGYGYDYTAEIRAALDAFKGVTVQ